ncbi:Fe-Mn family superoxide dismutase [Arcticibacter pallidicorallinus]|uniref:Superoxide dismutase n=1 Tax=Arcticibacter pallidicorallinus TaxID=1259464 RepID=A0A2T0TYT0_9SPHI|nr:superoxide dismutase [Arcticibacter pallidicorallinus]PRY50847.1 Fe-Mn family superoxide dismutase [Arcticibacter pallidicorallinus]
MKLKTLLITGLLFVAVSDQLKAQFTLPELPYGYGALEPAIDKETMALHHGKHHAGYVSNLNMALKGTGMESKSLEQILGSLKAASPAVRNNAGGHYNHSLFWKIMSPKSTEPSAALVKAINKDFGSLDIFKSAFADSAAKRFGSGWAWLIVQNGNLKISSTPNQDNPLMDVVTEKGSPILALDVWEHAYYLKYQNKRADYISSWWKVVNWQAVEELYHQAKK